IPVVPFAKVAHGTLVSTLPTNGKVEPFVWETVRAEAAGTIDQLSVREGQSVARGNVLATLRLSGVQPDLAGLRIIAASPERYPGLRIGLPGPIADRSCPRPQRAPSPTRTAPPCRWSAAC